MSSRAGIATQISSVRFPLTAAGYLSKLDLYDAMFHQAYEQLFARIDAAELTGPAREQLLLLSRDVVDFVVENPPRQQLLFG